MHRATPARAGLRHPQPPERGARQGHDPGRNSRHPQRPLIETQGIGDLYRLYLLAQRDGLDFNLAYIGADFTTVHKEDFDTAYMRALFDYGYQLGKKGYPWQKAPPGLTAARNS